MKASPSKPLPAGTRAGRSGKRHWFQITGLPGWKRAQLSMPAFGEADCVPHLPPTSRRARQQQSGAAFWLVKRAEKARLPVLPRLRAGLRAQGA